MWQIVMQKAGNMTVFTWRGIWRGKRHGLSLMQPAFREFRVTRLARHLARSY